jgi:hypothetical protein
MVHERQWVQLWNGGRVGLGNKFSGIFGGDGEFERISRIKKNFWEFL